MSNHTVLKKKVYSYAWLNHSFWHILSIRFYKGKNTQIIQPKESIVPKLKKILVCTVFHCLPSLSPMLHLSNLFSLSFNPLVLVSHRRGPSNSVLFPVYCKLISLSKKTLSRLINLANRFLQQSKLMSKTEWKNQLLTTS